MRMHERLDQRIAGFEAFGQVFPMWGTTPFYRVSGFAATFAGGLMSPNPKELFIARLDADTLFEGVGVFFANPNRAIGSEMIMEINGAEQNLPPGDVLFGGGGALGLTVGNGLYGQLQPLNLFLKKGATFRILGRDWILYEGEASRTGIVAVKGWTYAS